MILDKVENLTGIPVSSMKAIKSERLNDSMYELFYTLLDDKYASDSMQIDSLGRPTWDSIWIAFTCLLAERSVDPRMKVGCIITTHDNTQILSLGYNGDHLGGPNLVASIEPGKSEFIHAEENALIKLNYENAKKKKMYLNVSPCKMCAKKIINANINEVIYLNEYRDTSGLELLKAANIVIRHYVAPKKEGKKDEGPK